MSSIGRLTTALLQGTQETTLALANLNFDFSLVKVSGPSVFLTYSDVQRLDAPLEFRGVGESLTRYRREDAEVGSSHVTARKLGALYEQVVPNTPRLFEAYGRRASEIANHGPKASKKVVHSTNSSIISNYVGADATSIWAAATSGRGAISVHLLACML